jgi:TonB family protein
MLQYVSRTLTYFLLLTNVIAFNILTCSNVFAIAPLYYQEENPAWERYTTRGEKFSVVMPELPGVILKTTCLDVWECESKRVDRTYAAYGDGVVYYVTSYPNPNLRQKFKVIITDTLQRFELDKFNVTPKGVVERNMFKGERYLIMSKNGLYDSEVTFYLTKNHVYEIAVVAEDLTQSSIKEFFESFVLGSAEGKEIGDGARTHAESLANQVSPKVYPQGSKDSQPVINRAQPDSILKPNDVTRKARIVLKPAPEYTEEARQNQVTGTVTLQMVFASSGRVTNIRTIDSLPHGLTENAISAARKIYFLPAIKDGKRVSQYIRVEYNFNIY